MGTRLGADCTFLQFVCLSNKLEDKSNSFHSCNSKVLWILWSHFARLNRVSAVQFQPEITNQLVPLPCLSGFRSSQLAAGLSCPGACHWVVGVGWETLWWTQSAVTLYFCFCFVHRRVEVLIQCDFALCFQSDTKPNCVHWKRRCWLFDSTVNLTRRNLACECGCLPGHHFPLWPCCTPAYSFLPQVQKLINFIYY